MLKIIEKKSLLSLFLFFQLCSFDSFAAALRSMGMLEGLASKVASRPVSIRWVSTSSELASDLESLGRSHNPTGDRDTHPPKVPVDLHPRWDLAVSHQSFAREIGLVNSVQLDHELGLKGTVKKKS